MIAKLGWLLLYAVLSAVEFVVQKAKGAVEDRLSPPKKDEPGDPGDPDDEKHGRGKRR